MLRFHRPNKIIEIGCGYSSACTLDTVDRYLNGDCQLTFIEPFPQRLLDLIGDAAKRVRILDHPVQDTPLGIFEELSSGDILFIDSTHVLRPGSDVCFELFQVLPRLARGVLVHFHDMFWPFEYPRSWIVQENRSWNELYVRAFLMYNKAWEIVMGTSKNGGRSSGCPELSPNDSVLFSVRFCAVHPKDVGDCRPLQFFEVPLRKCGTRGTSF